MIKATELRIGNWINANPEVHKHLTPETLAHQVNARLIYDMTEANIVERHHDPIEINNYWFEKFGFKKVEMMFENIPMNYWRKGKLIVHANQDWTDLICPLTNDKEEDIFVNVKYVHKLQNLHFALFGAEL